MEAFRKLVGMFPKADIKPLFDFSGGHGVYAPSKWAVHEKDSELLSRGVGFAGGIGPENTINVVRQIEENLVIGSEFLVNTQIWIDMESGVRTEDWFDLRKVEQVIRQINLMMQDH